MHKTKQPVALITGSARRIGATIAKKLHAANFNVIIHYLHSAAEAELLVQEFNFVRENSAISIKADLNLKREVERLANEAYQWQMKVNLLVNNASLFIKDEEKIETLWENLFTVNVKAPWWLSHSLQESLAKEKGAIINITDIHGEKPLKHYGIYSQSKAALHMQTKILAREFAPSIRVNAIAPGAIAWPENQNTLSEETQKEIIAKTPLKKHGKPAYIAQAVLAIAENQFITGQTLNVDGGRSIT
ncbi:pteridine reductase [Legionella adelaidensis]|uniref:Pteridine reductase n=1 Tax=Legionella adelaidensis TaxID=45056 RepID=A0A0W0R1B8_9GAMM|nr:pteridine reductase [Legionella adelaidensis]KTC64826.1 pteridine reductase [Legionella adelaidensis]